MEHHINTSMRDNKTEVCNVRYNFMSDCFVKKVNMLLSKGDVRFEN